MAPVLKDVDDSEGVMVETRDFPPSHYLVKIESFSLFPQINVDKYESSEFETGGCKWRLIIYLDRKEGGSEGSCESEGSHVSVYLSVADTSSLDMSLGVHAVFGIFLRDQKSDKFFCKRVSPGQARWFDTLTPAWGFSKFIPKKMLVDPSSGYLVEDSCIFGAEVFVFKKPAIERLSLMDVKHTRSWSISEFSELESEWKSETFSVGDMNWYVLIEEEGGKYYKGCEIGIYLNLADEDNPPLQKVKVNFTLRVKDQINGEDKAVSEDIWFAKPGDSWGDIITLVADTSKETNGFFVNDCCIVELEMSVGAVAQRSP